MTNTLSHRHRGQIHLLYCYSTPTHLSNHPISLSLSLVLHLLNTSPPDVATALFLLAPRCRLLACNIVAGKNHHHLSALCLVQRLLSRPSRGINQRLIERCCKFTRRRLDRVGVVGVRLWLFTTTACVYHRRRQMAEQHVRLHFIS